MHRDKLYGIKCYKLVLDLMQCMQRNTVQQQQVGSLLFHACFYASFHQPHFIMAQEYSLTGRQDYHYMHHYGGDTGQQGGSITITGIIMGGKQASREVSLHASLWQRNTVQQGGSITITGIIMGGIQASREVALPLHASLWEEYGLAGRQYYYYRHHYGRGIQASREVALPLHASLWEEYSLAGRQHYHCMHHCHT